MLVELAIKSVHLYFVPYSITTGILYSKCNCNKLMINLFSSDSWDTQFALGLCHKGVPRFWRRAYFLKTSSVNNSLLGAVVCG